MQYLQNILSHDLTFSIGPAGTGKTYLAVACAVDALEREAVKRIVLVRPAVEAGERLGFLPGDMAAKVDPYLRPLYDALYDLMGYDKVAKLFDRGAIEIAPLAFMRGRTLNHSFVILDEAQNTTPEQMKMFLTRIGFGSKAVVDGDITQIDLARGQKSGLVEAQEVLKKVRGIAFTRFGSEDVVRHPLVQRIVNAYENQRSHGAGASPARRARKLTMAVQYGARARGLPTPAAAAPLGARGARAQCASHGTRCANHRAHRRQRGRRGRSTGISAAGTTRPTCSPSGMRDRPALEGDLALCAPVIAREARAQGKSLAAHYAHLVVHGVLHLQGYDHENRRDARRMERRESRIVTALGFPDPYAGTGEGLRSAHLGQQGQPKAPLLDRIGAWIARKPEDRDELIELLRASHAARPARRGCARDDRGRAPGLRDAGARHHGAALADGRHRHPGVARPVHSRWSCRPGTRASP